MTNDSKQAGSHERFNRGGYIPGPVTTVEFVAECSPDGEGRLGVVFADECIVDQDKNCTRTDRLHWAVPGAVKNRQARWFICPMHDGGRYPGRERGSEWGGGKDE